MDGVKDKSCNYRSRKGLTGVRSTPSPRQVSVKAPGRPGWFSETV